MGCLAFYVLLFKRRTWRLVAQVVIRFDTGYIGFSYFNMGWGTHNNVAILAAGRPNRRVSKTCVTLGVGSSLSRGRLLCNVAVMELKVLELRESVDQDGPSFIVGLHLSTQAKRMEMRPRSVSNWKEVKS